MSKGCEDWMRNAVAKGLQGLLSLRLEGAPGEDTVAITLEAWCAVLANFPHTWAEHRDRGRIQAAFIQLAAQCERWPSPAAFIRCLPPVENPTALPAPVSYEIPPVWSALVLKLTKRKA